MSVSIIDQSTGNPTQVSGNANDKVGNLSSLITTDKSSAVAAINEVENELSTTTSKAEAAYFDRITHNRFSGSNVTKTITFSGKTYTRCVSMILIACGQGGITEPISIGFGGTGVYEEITGVFVSPNNYNITASDFTITIPSGIGYNWGVHTLFKLFQDDELTYTIS